MGFLDDELERKRWAAADAEEEEDLEFLKSVVEAENILGSEPVEALDADAESDVEA